VEALKTAAPTKNKRGKKDTQTKKKKKKKKDGGLETLKPYPTMNRWEL